MSSQNLPAENCQLCDTNTPSYVCFNCVDLRSGKPDDKDFGYILIKKDTNFLSAVEQQAHDIVK